MIVIEGINYFGIMVSNLDTSIQFYRDVFDFDYLDRLSDDTRAFMKMGDVTIALIRQEGNSGLCRLSLLIDADDFDDIVDDIEEENYTILSPVDDDNLTVIIADPDGNEIEITAQRTG